MEKNQYTVNLNDYSEEKEAIHVFMSKPMIAIITMAVVAVVLLFTALWPLGIFIMIIVAITVFKVPNRKVLAVYNDALMIYDRKDASIAQFVPFDKIKEWKIQPGKTSGDILFLLLEEDDMAFAELYGSSKLIRILSNLIPEKDSINLRKQEMNSLHTPLFRRRNKKN